MSRSGRGGNVAVVQKLPGRGGGRTRCPAPPSPARGQADLCSELWDYGTRFHEPIRLITSKVLINVAGALLLPILVARWQINTPPRQLEVVPPRATRPQHHPSRLALLSLDYNLLFMFILRSVK